MSIFEYAALILTTADSLKKATLTLEAFELWTHQKLSTDIDNNVPIPDSPARPALNVVPPNEMPGRVKGDAVQNKLMLIHSFAHIESYAIDLSWDIILRFRDASLPVEFYSDWIKVAEDEARHFIIWKNRLEELESFYGDFPVHDGLWQSAEETSGDLLDRLAIVHMVHEARGLDVAPKSKARLSSSGDKKSAELLQFIYEEEIDHVRKGMKWFLHICEQRKIVDPITKFHSVVKNKFFGKLKPPFNEEARSAAGFTEEWYQPLV